MNFNLNFDQFVSDLGLAHRDCENSRENILGQTSRWQKFADARFEGLARFSQASDRSAIDGEIIGKKFSLELLQEINGHAGIIEAVVIQPRLGGGVAELGRFKVNKQGDVIDDAGNVVIDLYEDKGSCALMLAVLNLVIESKVQIKI
ncbi:hypothetical protein [Pseudomonas sp.]|uniref:hypothetical protein n=1 Tax=Pseudomonas sp. TaxID=306 RepID=UPI0028B045D5|nr:hypothetical protein [Pseudomonas sp.]